MSDLPFNTALRTLPQLKDLLDAVKRDIFLTLNCHALATVQSFNAQTQKVVAKINYSRTVVNESGDQVPVDYPLIADVPVVILCGGTTYLTLPIAAGDQVLVLFNDRDIDNWASGARSGQVNSPRLHSFSDGIALVGLNTISSYDTVRALLSNGTVKLGINPSTNKVTLGNSTSLNTVLQSILTHLQNLVTQISAITVTCANPGSPSSVPVNAAAITTIGTQLATDATNLGNILE